MNCDQFLSELRAALRGLPPQEVDDIVADYRAYFTEAQAEGRGDEEVASALGDPTRLAKELRAESRMKQWKEKRTPKNFVGAVIALCGLAAIDLILLLPLLCVLGLIAFVMGVVLFALIVAGLAILASPVWGPRFGDWSYSFSMILAGIGLISGSVGLGALLLLTMEGVLLLLSRYARLHYQLIRPEAPAG
jgi:uncharacterized membrane protein